MAGLAGSLSSYIRGNIYNSYSFSDVTDVAGHRGHFLDVYDLL